MNNIDTITGLLNLNDTEIKTMFMCWDKGDCSDVGICEILLYQLIKQHKQENSVWYNQDYDEIKLRYGK